MTAAEAVAREGDATDLVRLRMHVSNLEEELEGLRAIAGEGGWESEKASMEVQLSCLSEEIRALINKGDWAEGLDSISERCKHGCKAGEEKEGELERVRAELAEQRLVMPNVEDAFCYKE